jgi:hypothetical protein
MGEAGGGRNEVDPRFISMFSVFNLTFPSDETVQHIYRSILSGHVQIFTEEIQKAVPDVIEMTLSLFKVSEISLIRFKYILKNYHTFSNYFINLEKN